MTRQKKRRLSVLYTYHVTKNYLEIVFTQLIMYTEQTINNECLQGN